MTYANLIETTDIHAAAEDAALFAHSDVEDILVHLETNVEELATLVRDLTAH